MNETMTDVTGLEPSRCEGLRRIPISVAETSGIARRREPVTMGLPLPRGLVRATSQLALVTAAGAPAPLQAGVLSRWADGSAKWVLLDLQADVAPLSTARYEVVVVGETDMEVQSPSGVVVSETSGTIHIATGSAEFTLDRRRGVLTGYPNGGGFRDEAFRAVWRLQPETGVVAEPRVTKAWVETAGALRTTVRREGDFDQPDGTRCQFFESLSFFAGSDLVRLTFTVRNPRRARHRKNFWDLGDPGSIHIRDLSLAAELVDPAPRRVVWSIAPDDPLGESAGARVEIYQDSSGGPNWQSPNHVNGRGRITPSFRGCRVRDGAEVSYRRRAQPLVGSYAGSHGVGGTVRDFWQKFPKAIEVEEDGRLVIRLFPGQSSDVHELQGGEQTTHELYLSYLADPSALERMAWVRTPLVAQASPEWCAESRAVPYLTPRSDDPSPEYLGLVDAAIEGEHSFEGKREIIDEYGWRHFGDIYADHEGVHYGGPPPVVSHYNNQYDALYGAFVHFLRSGDERWFRMMNELARHVVDIDIYHTTEDRAAYNGGLFWHTNHYTDAATATHRSYSRRAGRGTGGPGNEHCYATGLVYHYFMTGDTASRDAAIDLARWVLDSDDGRRHRFGWLDRGATGAASATASPSYHGPGRGPANSVTTLLNGFVLTQERAFLDKAEALIRRCIHPRDDLAARNLSDAERRWSYTMFLQALGRYLDLKIELEELDGMYTYARESLLAYARWMVAHEVPYLTRAERLEFPTETWAAQDMRKSEVFLFAARHSPSAERGRFRERADFFFRASVDQLVAAPTHALTRPVVLLMTNGYMRAYFESRSTAVAPLPRVPLAAGEPERFVPLRDRIKFKAKLAAGAGLVAGFLAIIALWSLP